MGTELTGDTRQIQLPLDLGAPASARSFACETLSRWNCENMTDEVSLVVSEVVTNAVVHAQTAMTLTLLNSNDAVQIRVHDGERQRPKLRRSTDDDTNGRGIFLVEAICAEWGVDEAHPGKVVWLNITKH